MLLVYGPLAQWFIAADRVVYDQIAARAPNMSLSDGFIVSIDPKRSSKSEILAQYGRIIETLQNNSVKRIILASPPDVSADAELPAWSALLSARIPVFVPTRHRFSDVAKHHGFVEFNPDDDRILRQTILWQLNNGIYSPSLPLAVAVNSSADGEGNQLSSADATIFLSNYADLPRIGADELLSGTFDTGPLYDATVFVDSDPAFVGAAAVLPSGQLVTNSEIAATLLANVENNRTISSPSGIQAMQWLIPALLAIVAVLFMPDRDRREIAILTATVVVSLLLIEAVLLLGFQLRMDLGRPILIFVGVALLCSWLVVDVGKVSGDAFKKGSDFLAAGRLEDALAAQSQLGEPLENMLFSHGGGEVTCIEANEIHQLREHVEALV